MKAKFTTFHVLPMTPQLRRVLNHIYKGEILPFARCKTNMPDLEDLSGHPELESLCDLLFLSRLGIIECHFTDAFAEEGETLLLKLNLE